MSKWLFSAGKVIAGEDEDGEESPSACFTFLTSDSGSDAYPAEGDGVRVKDRGIGRQKVCPGGESVIRSVLEGNREVLDASYI